MKRNKYREIPEVPTHVKKVKRKRFGIEYQSLLSDRKYHDWYATEKARDRAFKNLSTKTSILRGTKWDSPMTKVER